RTTRHRRYYQSLTAQSHLTHYQSLMFSMIFIFFFTDTPTTEIYTLSLHDALPILNIIARRTGKDVNSHTVLDGIITTIMATIQRINIIGSREGSRNRRRLKANQTGKKFRVGIKSNISTNRNNLISGVD